MSAPTKSPEARETPRLLIIGGLALVLLAVGSNMWLQSSAPPVVQAQVVGHRGAPGHLPDHTLEGYRLAVRQGADAIEPDLVSTSDGVLIARHENDLTHTTDVADRFPERRTTKTVDGEAITGWFAEDFTLAEIKTLRAVQPMDSRPDDFDGQYTIPTFDEVLDLREELSAQRPIAVVPETKHPSYFHDIGLPLEPAMLRSLSAHGLDGPDAPVLIQSFELKNLVQMDTTLPKLLLIWKDDTHPWGDPRTYGELLSDLPALAEQVQAIGVSKDRVWSERGPTSLVRRAHQAGLQVYVYTFRNEPDRLGPAAEGSPRTELMRFMEQGVDGVFADFPDEAVAARNVLLTR